MGVWGPRRGRGGLSLSLAVAVTLGRSAGLSGRADPSPAQDTGAILINEPLVVGPQLVHVWQVGTLGVQVKLAALREGQ